MNDLHLTKRYIKERLDTYQSKQTWHLLHLILTLVTVLWGVVWIVVWINNKEQQVKAMEDIRAIVDDEYVGETVDKPE